MLNTHTNGRYSAMFRLLFGGQGSLGRSLLRLHDQDAFTIKALKSGILIENTSRWQGISGFIGDTLLMDRSFICIAQKMNRAVFINNKDILERMPFLSTAIRERSFSFVNRVLKMSIEPILILGFCKVWKGLPGMVGWRHQDAAQREEKGPRCQRSPSIPA